jgi:hypothetical protein
MGGAGVNDTSPRVHPSPLELVRITDIELPRPTHVTQSNIHIAF